MQKEIIARTGTKDHETVLLWKIDDLKVAFMRRHSNIDKAAYNEFGMNTIPGPEIIMPTQPKTTWKTFIDSIMNCYIFRVVLIEEQEDITFHINYDLSVGNEETELVPILSSYIHERKSHYFQVPFLHHLQALNEEQTTLDSKNLIIKCRFGVLTTSTALDVSDQEISARNDFNCLSDNLSTLYSSKIFSDFTIVVEGKSFPVHKCILSSRSSVFAALLNCDTMETSSNKLVIKDIKIKTIEAFLLFIYTGQLGELSADEYCKLYSVSDKYALGSLKKISARNLLNSISADNVCDVYTLGYFHEDSALKLAAISFIKQNVSSVLISENWKNLISKNSQIAAQIMKEEGILCAL